MLLRSGKIASGNTEKAEPRHNAKSPTKRTKQDFKDEDAEDEEPVRKRSRRSDTKKGSALTTTKPSVPKPNDVKISSKATSKKQNHSKNPVASSNDDDLASVESAVEREPVPKHATSNPTSRLEDGLQNGDSSKSTKAVQTAEIASETASEVDDEEAESEEDDEKPEVAAKKREKVQSTLKSSSKDPYPDWKAGEAVPYAALCTTFSLVEMTTKRLIISSHCSLFLRQVLRLTPQDLLPTIQLMINKLAADYAGIELGIGESLIMKAIGETTGRSLSIIKADQNEIGDLGLVAAKSRSNQPTMFKPKALTVRGVHEGLMGIATVSGDGSQGRKIAGIKKLLSAADAALAGKGNKGVDITKDKGGSSEAKFIVRFLEGKLRLGLAERTVLVALAHAMIIHETEKKSDKTPSSEQLAKGEAILKTVYRYVSLLSIVGSVFTHMIVSCQVTKLLYLRCSNMVSSASEKTANSNLVSRLSPCLQNLRNRSQRSSIASRARISLASTSTMAKEHRFTTLPKTLHNNTLVA